MDICIDKSCSFTGHRKGKLFGSEEKIRKELRKEINEAISSGYDTFISGMATGVDTYGALEVLNIKRGNKDIKLVCAVPFKGVEKKRADEEQRVFQNILEQADYVYFVCSEYSKECFRTRDRWMVDNSSRVISVFNGLSGGTKYTIDYAKEKNRKIVIIQDKVDV